VSELRLHLDEDAEAHALIRALRDRGVDVTTTSEAGMTESSDEDQLDWATAASRVLLTYNAADFCRIHSEFAKIGRGHAGIIVAELRRLLRIRTQLSADAMRNRIEFLNRW